MDLKINQEYIVSCFLYNFIENWFLKGCASINTPFIEIAFRLQSMFIFIITSIYETIQAPAPTTCIHKLVKWFVKLKKTTLNFRTSNFSFRWQCCFIQANLYISWIMTLIYTYDHRVSQPPNTSSFFLNNLKCNCHFEIKF